MDVVVAVLIFAGCFAKIIMIFLYNRLVEDSFGVADCNSELIKQIKLRYSNQIKLELPIQDAGKFVARYIYQYSKILKAVSVLDMVSLIMMLAGIALNHERQYFTVEVLLIATFIYLAVGLLVDGAKKETIVINNIADYLVNNMNIRTAAKEHRIQVKENLKNVAEVRDIDTEVTVPKKTKIIANTANENIIIEEVLREFLEA